MRIAKIVPILILCLVAIGVFVSCGGYPGSPEGILKQDAKAFRDGDAKTHYETCTPDSRDGASFEKYEELFREHAFYRKPVEFKNIEVEYWGNDEANTWWDLYIGGEPQGDRRLQHPFEKIDGKWYKACVKPRSY